MNKNIFNAALVTAFGLMLMFLSINGNKEEINLSSPRLTAGVCNVFLKDIKTTEVASVELKEQIIKALKYDCQLGEITENNDGAIISQAPNGVGFSVAQPLKEYAEVDDNGSVKTMHQILSITPEKNLQKNSYYNYQRGTIINITISDCCEGTAVIRGIYPTKGELDIYFIKEPIMCEKSHLESLKMTVSCDKILSIKRAFMRTHCLERFNKEKWLQHICRYYARNSADIVKLVDDFNSYDYEFGLELMRLKAAETHFNCVDEIQAYINYFELNLPKDLRVFREY